VKSRTTVVVTGLIGQHPKLGGMTWHYLNYVLGFERLGHDVYYIEDSGEWPYNLDGGASGEDFSVTSCAANVAYLAAVMQEWNLGDRWAYRCPIDGTWSGLASRQIDALVERADVVINVSGSLARPERYRGRGRLAYVDTDPVFTQIKLNEGDTAARVNADVHDVHFTFGELVSEAFPSHGVTWLPTRQPVVIDAWQGPSAPNGPYTTVMNWWSYAPTTYGGRPLGQKDVEFARFLDLPRDVDVTLEIAVHGTVNGTLPGWGADDHEPHDLTAALEDAGWHVADAVTRCDGAQGYRSYILGSRAEWSVAKEAYVATRSGWFSDRSACYLAAGRPVILQDTGYSEVLPVGEGLLAFRNVEEAVAAIGAVEAEYEHHARCASAIAADFFDSNRVLTKLLDDAMQISVR